MNRVFLSQNQDQKRLFWEFHSLWKTHFQKKAQSIVHMRVKNKPSTHSWITGYAVVIEALVLVIIRNVMCMLWRQVQTRILMQTEQKYMFEFVWMLIWESSWKLLSQQCYGKTHCCWQKPPSRTLFWIFLLFLEGTALRKAARRKQQSTLSLWKNTKTRGGDVLGEGREVLQATPSAEPTASYHRCD